MLPFTCLVSLARPNARNSIASNFCSIRSRFNYECLTSFPLSGNGYYSKLARSKLDNINESGSALLTQSCTQALEFSLELLDIKPGDEIIIPSFNFTSAATAVVARGAIPVFIDVDSRTLNVDPELIQNAASENTKAIILTHYAGVTCDFDKILHISKKLNIKIIEDNAHGLGAKFRDKKLGTVGDLGTLSFHETKNIQSGEGGAIIINDLSLIERAEIYREKGTNRTKYFRGEVDKYSWVGSGSSFIQSDILAALLLGQLEEFDIIQDQRKEIWKYYNEKLYDWAGEQKIKLPIIPDYATSSYHIFYLITDTVVEQKKIIEHLKSNGIQAVFHYLPLHSSLAGEKFGVRRSGFSQTNRISKSIVRLPIWYEISEKSLNYVIDTLKKYKVNS